ncbi:hypothetical protein N0V90_002837 [Kalmusia sp. IMI 367209]|nr:hypothetical protein N0V90_002837 [Kalmusia sp. IMI 367209]
MESFFAKSLRPLSPPESPFHFDAAFKKPLSAVEPAPASPHFELPALVKRKAASPVHAKAPAQTKAHAQPKKGARGTQDTSNDNPYFPSIAEQERQERLRLRGWMPEPSPPAEPEAEFAPTNYEAPQNADMSAPLERRRPLKISLPARRQDWPASPASMESASGSGSEGCGSVSVEEYRKGMKDYLEKGLQGRRRVIWSP